MVKQPRQSYLFFSILVSFMINASLAVATPFPESGLVTPVKNYSSNPYWNSNGSYNQRFPQVVYLDGPDLNSGDCERAVSILVANECAQNNNCIGKKLTDIRPSIMVKLSQLPGHNYATACAGYLDYIFEQYLNQHSVTQQANVNFSMGTPQRIQTYNNKIVKNTQQKPESRADELARLQAENGANNIRLIDSNFPTTIADLSLQERWDNDKTGLMPYKDKSAYTPINIDFENKTTSKFDNSTTAEIDSSKRSSIQDDNNQQALAQSCKPQNIILINLPTTTLPKDEHLYIDKANVLNCDADHCTDGTILYSVINQETVTNPTDTMRFPFIHTHTNFGQPFITYKNTPGYRTFTCHTETWDDYWTENTVSKIELCNSAEAKKLCSNKSTSNTIVCNRHPSFQNEIDTNILTPSPKYQLCTTPPCKCPEKTSKGKGAK